MNCQPGAFQSKRDFTKAILSILACIAVEVAVASLVIWGIIRFIKAVEM